MSNSSIPQLTEFQYKSLDLTANRTVTSFAVLEAPETDTVERKEKAAKNMGDIDGLIRLGLVTDVSEFYAESIEDARAVHGSGYRVFTLTDHAVKMFRSSGNRTAN